MMVERIAAGPPDKVNIGINQVLSIEADRLARMQQHVRDTGHRYESLERIDAGVKTG